MKKYANAKQVLPDHLVEEIQNYIQGSYLYIPKKERKAWGANSEIRDELYLRNKRIVNNYSEGFDVSQLANMYYLSENQALLS